MKRRLEKYFSMNKALTIIFALLLGGCELALIPKRPPLSSHIYFAAEQPVAYEKVTVIYNDCDRYQPEPYYHTPLECTEFYDYHSGVYEGTCCTWETFDDYYIYEEEWCDWVDSCVGWTYAGSERY